MTDAEAAPLLAEQETLLAAWRETWCTRCVMTCRGGDKSKSTTAARHGDGCPLPRLRELHHQLGDRSLEIAAFIEAVKRVQEMR